MYIRFFPNRQTSLAKQYGIYTAVYGEVTAKIRITVSIGQGYEINGHYFEYLNKVSRWEQYFLQSASQDVVVEERRKLKP